MPKRVNTTGICMRPGCDRPARRAIHGYFRLHCGWKCRRADELDQMRAHRRESVIDSVIHGDNLSIMADLSEASVDLIYCDPPYNTGKDWNDRAGEFAFSDRWGSDEAYFEAVEAWLRAAHRLLKPSGSLYWQCDPKTSHYTKVIADQVFGEANFRNEIVWRRYVSVNNSVRSRFNSVHDIIFYYAAAPEPYFDMPYLPVSQRTIERAYCHRDERGVYMLQTMTEPHPATDSACIYEFMGVRRHWRFTEENAQRLLAEGRIVQAPGGMPRVKFYLDESRGRPLDTIWDDCPNLHGGALEDVGYPTQKPLALLERIISASCPEGGLVLDPFCGSGTTLVAAKRLRRHYIGIDLSDKAITIARQRLRAQQAPML